MRRRRGLSLETGNEASGALQGCGKVPGIISFDTQVRGAVTCEQFASFEKPSQPAQGSPSLISFWPSPDPQI